MIYNICMNMSNITMTVFCIITYFLHFYNMYVKLEVID